MDPNHKHIRKPHQTIQATPNSKAHLSWSVENPSGLLPHPPASSSYLLSHSPITAIVFDGPARPCMALKMNQWLACPSKLSPLLTPIINLPSSHSKCIPRIWRWGSPRTGPRSNWVCIKIATEWIWTVIGFDPLPHAPHSPWVTSTASPAPLWCPQYP